MRAQGLHRQPRGRVQPEGHLYQAGDRTRDLAACLLEALPPASPPCSEGKPRFDLSCLADDDGSCSLVLTGCTDSRGVNFRKVANFDDGSCIISGCMDSTATDYDPLATAPAMCQGSIRGCTDSVASNFESEATKSEPGDCVYLGCTDSTSSGFKPKATVDDGSCPPHQPGACALGMARARAPLADALRQQLSCRSCCCFCCPTLHCLRLASHPSLSLPFSGCTDLAAANYKADYTKDDGSCSYGGCLDPSDPNFNMKATFGDKSACANSKRRRMDGEAGSGDVADPSSGEKPNATNPTDGCPDPHADTYDPLATTRDTSLCVYGVHGCINATAVNFNPNATCLTPAIAPRASLATPCASPLLLPRLAPRPCSEGPAALRSSLWQGGAAGGRPVHLPAARLYVGRRLQLRPQRDGAERQVRVPHPRLRRLHRR